MEQLSPTEGYFVLLNSVSVLLPFLGAKQGDLGLAMFIAAVEE